MNTDAFQMCTESENFGVMNITSIYNESVQSTLHINLTHQPNSLQLQHISWRYNGMDIDLQNSTKYSLRVDGGLNIHEVEPNDAGCYIVVVSTELDCLKLHFKVFIKCKIVVAVQALRGCV